MLASALPDLRRSQFVDLRSKCSSCVSCLCGSGLLLTLFFNQSSCHMWLCVCALLIVVGGYWQLQFSSLLCFDVAGIASR